jgi:hypothetical protein
LSIASAFAKPNRATISSHKGEFRMLSWYRLVAASNCSGVGLLPGNNA